MLLGFVVLVEVDARPVVVLHGVTGQQLSEKHTPIIKMIHVIQSICSLSAPFLKKKKTNHSCDVTTGGRTLTRLIYCLDVSAAKKLPTSQRLLCK